MIRLWFEFIRYCLDDTKPLPKNIEKMDWAGLYQFCQEQAIAGVVFNDARWKKDDVRPPRKVLLQWFALSEQIKQRNIRLNQRCAELVAMLQKDGFGSCILKGQGNALMYPNPLSRTPGDIDILVTPRTRNREEKLSVRDIIMKRRKVVTEYVRKKFPETRIRYHHIDYPVFPDVEIEVHFIPTAKNNPIYNRRIQRWAEEWFDKKADGGCVMAELPNGQGTIPVPSVECNVIYQLSHLMHHFFDEGIGLRQFVDYFYLLKNEECRVESEEYVTAIQNTLKYLGLWKFAGAVMYVMREVFALEEQYMFAPVDEKRGRTLLREILKGGNFGKYSGLSEHGTVAKYLLKNWRSLQLIREYPAEALAEPLFRTYHFFWRIGK